LTVPSISNLSNFQNLSPQPLVVIAIRFSSSSIWHNSQQAQNRSSVLFFKNIMKTAVGWLRQQVIPEPPIVTQSITQTYPPILSHPQNLLENHLCPRLQLWLKVVSVDLRQVRSWDPDHPANMALTMLWGRYTSLKTLQKALVVEKFFAGIGENAKWRLYLAMSRVSLQAYAIRIYSGSSHADIRPVEGQETPPTAGEKEDDGVHTTPDEAAADKALQSMAQTSSTLGLGRCTASLSSGRIECALRRDYRAPCRYPNA
ncbi:hypothetical protein PspLS_01892, partial [Pyricularia sp. CBS 133598]